MLEFFRLARGLVTGTMLRLFNDLGFQEKTPGFHQGLDHGLANLANLEFVLASNLKAIVHVHAIVFCDRKFAIDIHLF